MNQRFVTFRTLVSFEIFSSWWLNHPFEKYESNWKSSPSRGWKWTNVWNHYLAWMNLFLTSFFSPWLLMFTEVNASLSWQLPTALFGAATLRHIWGCVATSWGWNLTHNFSLHTSYQGLLGSLKLIWQSFRSVAHLFRGSLQRGPLPVQDPLVGMK